MERVEFGGELGEVGVDCVRFGFEVGEGVVGGVGAEAGFDGGFETEDFEGGGGEFVTGGGEGGFGGVEVFFEGGEEWEDLVVAEGDLE